MTLQIATDTIGDRLRRKRTALGLQRTELGARLGMTERQLRNYETGSERPNDLVIEVLAGALGLDAGELGALPTRQDPEGIRADELHERRVQAFADAPVGEGRAAAAAVTASRSTADLSLPAVPAPVDTVVVRSSPAPAGVDVPRQARAIRLYMRIVARPTLPDLEAEVNDALGLIGDRFRHLHHTHLPTVTFHTGLLGDAWAAITYLGDRDLFAAPARGTRRTARDD